MENKDLKCPVCGGSFEDGFILDIAFGWGKWQCVSRWVEGKPKMLMSGVPAYTDRRNLNIDAARCTQCGHLALFANKET